MWLYLQETADLVTFTEEILNWKVHSGHVENDARDIEPNWIGKKGKKSKNTEQQELNAVLSRDEKIKINRKKAVALCWLIKNILKV